MALRSVDDRKIELLNKVREAKESALLLKENKNSDHFSGLISELWEYIEASEPADKDAGIKKSTTAADYIKGGIQAEIHESILNSLDDGIISFSFPDFKSVYTSNAFFSICKRLPGEFPENIDLLTRFCFTEDKKALNNFINQLKNKNQDELEYRIVLPGNQLKWILNKARVDRDASGKAIRVDFTLSDISEKKLFQQYADRFSQTLLNLGFDFSENINSLTSLFGELFGATCALYNRMEDGLLCSIGQWATPPDFNSKDKPDGHICYDVIKNSSTKILLVRNLPDTIYAETDPNVGPYNLKTYVGRAVFCEGEAVGSVCAVYQADFSPGIEHETLLNMIANAIGVEEVRRKAARVLKENEEKLKILINATPDIICFKDAEGRWLQANDGILKIYELENVDYVGKTDKELADFTANIYKDGFRQCSTTDEQAWLSGALSRVEERIPDRSGKQHVYDVIKVPVYNADSSRKGMVVFGRDITYRIEAEEQTRLLNQCALEFLELDDNANIYEFIGEKVHQLAGKSYIMVTSFDETNQLATLQSVHGVGKTIDKVLKILGQHPVGMTSYLTPERKKDVLYQKLTFRESLYEMLSGAISQPVSMILESILDIGQIYEMGFARRDFLIGDVTIITPKNKPLQNVEVLEAFIKVAAVALHRRQVKDALTNSEESYRGLFNSITSSVYIMNKDGRFVDVNDGAVAMYGYPRERFIGNSPEFLGAPGKNESVDVVAL
ncbi:MAG: PAS domain S-box protein, partial [Lentimicrobium sp.]|nr:PAS domain S-box protein [Lentimicrobium sp.]